MPGALAALVLATAALWVGGEQFVLGTSRLAERTRLPLILVGMVVAGFGTSTPELAVSLAARGRGETALAIGNALGSNVANVLLALPIASLAAAWVVRGDLLRREVLGVLVATAVTVAVAADGLVARAEAGVLLAVFVVLMSWLASSALRSGARARIETEISEMVGPAPRRRAVGAEVLRTLAGLAVVIVSADRLVWGASRIAREVGVSDATIGLTVVAVGTSLPELVTGVVAARRGEPDLVLGNILGSNLFNALLIIGLTGAVGPLSIAGAARTIALAGAGASALLLLPFLHGGFRMGRAHALAGLALYACFVATLYVAQ